MCQDPNSTLSASGESETTSVPGSRVIEVELHKILERRAHVFEFAVEEQSSIRVVECADEDDRLTKIRLQALEQHTVGLSFSGGGIRGGTFAVGFLQGLSQVRLLRRIDYLSTVSGGGYAGGWLAAWLKRDGDPRNVERQLHPNRVAQAEADRALLPPLDFNGLERRRVVDEEPTPLYHLRQFSSYLTPRPGLLTADTWTVIAIWLRNVSVNLVMLLLPITMIVILLARMIIYLYAYVSPAAINGDNAAYRVMLGLFAAGLLFFGVALYRNGKVLREFREPKRDGDYRTGDTRKRPRFSISLRSGILVPLILTSVLATIPLRGVIWLLGARTEAVIGGPRLTDSTLLHWVADYTSANLGLLELPNVLAHAVIVGGFMAFLALGVSLRDGIATWRGLKKYMSSAFIAGASAGCLIPLLEVLTRTLNDTGKSELAATIVPPLALLILVSGLFVEVALLGRAITEAEREWWSRLSAVVLMASLLWLLTMVSIIYVPAAFLAAGPMIRIALASGWLTTTGFGILGGKGAQLRKGNESTMTSVLAIVPPIFLIGFLGAVSLLGAFLVNMPSLGFPNGNQDWTAVDRYFQGVRGTSFWTLVGWMIFAILLFRIGTQTIDINLFSLHGMYANRLVRCYLGASRPLARWAERWGDIHDPKAGGCAPSLSQSTARSDTNLGAVKGDARNKLGKLRAAGRKMEPHTSADQFKLFDNVQARREESMTLVSSAVGMPARDENPETGFDPRDDIPLFDLSIGTRMDGRTYWGPQLLINTTLNLVAGEELAWRDRKGESFVLTPEYCGSKGVGYAKMTERTRENLTLGRAITISGAAVDPNMSFYQSSALTAFLTIFNARLGQWIQNPRFSGWIAEGPKFGDRLISELLGSTDDKGAYVHLSDGGHFENMGVYELIRRRCRYIVAVDCGEDAGASDDNLAQLTRLCRIDFGVRIELDTRPLSVEGPDGFSRSHAVVGRVHYEDVDSGQIPGIIVYVKTSLTGDEPSDVLRYARKDPRFPYQPTDLRQSFSDEQFESYRTLGDHIAREVFAESALRISDDPAGCRCENLDDYYQGNRRLFGSLQAQWATPAADREPLHVP